jgi:S-formylglutathione hydrolase FrmB
MVTRHPGIYSAALAFSSEEEPALAKERHRTVEASFGADTGAFERQTPLHLMQQQRFDSHAAYFAAGERDPQFVEDLHVLSGAARSAGFSVREQIVPGAGHSWEVAARGLRGGLDFLAPRWGITS